eukprot:TRINITY_DN5116_c0_g1_i1.p1 TRINITY_DN5116_c0_g1~~TRINITY_DN5116_c0_g1_i1.p1  ORF type:complete len:519 (+),score=120.71 TRINITY_DN5116_c0_g1_i1:71-1627(+)
MIRRPPRSTLSSSSAASDVYKRQVSTQSTGRNAGPTMASGLSTDNMNPRIKKAEYAVRGELVIKAGQYDAALEAGEKLPFSDIIYCNIGNPHSVGQVPLTFHRQVLALCMYPNLMENEQAMTGFPADAVARAKEILDGTGGNGLGAYSHSKGMASVRNTVAAFIENRDGYPTDPELLFLTNGASDGVGKWMDMLISSSNDGMLIPIPQYPLYSSGLTLRDGVAVPYYLDEANEWGMSVESLQQALDSARAEGTAVKALVVINPGNPTGQLLTYENMAGILEFCAKESIVLFADEVYQTNNYTDDRVWHSFRKVMLDKQLPVQLVSFHSTSKGYYGECGLRGGYFEALNIEPDVIDQVYKLSSMSLCSNLPGQIAVDLMVRPPKESDPSGSLFIQERDSQLTSLRRRAEKLTDALNQLTGISCNPSQGAMYAFPKIELPPKAVAAAKAAGKAPDGFYALNLLDATGICVVPGSGFGQVDGTWHFRTTFLPPEDQMDAVVERIREFHEPFMAKYTSRSLL